MLLAKITVISPLQMQVPVTITDTAMPIPTTVGCEFELLQGDFVYRGFLPTWTVGQDVRFRHSSGNIYLQRPNGKELKLDFLLQGKRVPDGTLTIMRRAKSLKK